jgi:hypothetical protein
MQVKCGRFFMHDNETSTVHLLSIGKVLFNVISGKIPRLPASLRFGIGSRQATRALLCTAPWRFERVDPGVHLGNSSCCKRACEE